MPKDINEWKTVGNNHISFQLNLFSNIVFSYNVPFSDTFINDREDFRETIETRLLVDGVIIQTENSVIHFIESSVIKGSLRLELAEGSHSILLQWKGRYINMYSSMVDPS